MPSDRSSPERGDAKSLASFNVQTLIESDWRAATGEVLSWLEADNKRRSEADFLLDFLIARSARIAPTADLGTAIAAIFLSLVAVLLSVSEGLQSAWLIAGTVVFSVAAGAVAVFFLGFSFLARSRSHHDLELLVRVRAVVLEDALVRSTLTRRARSRAPLDRLFQAGDRG
jgi:hypothetical protein